MTEGDTYPSAFCAKLTDSSTCITLTWSKFFVTHRKVLPYGSTSLSSITQDSALETMPFGNHLGMAPFLRMSLVVTKEPEGVWSRAMTSHEIT